MANKKTTMMMLKGRGRKRDILLLSPAAMFLLHVVLTVLILGPLSWNAVQVVEAAHPSHHHGTMVKGENLRRKQKLVRLRQTQQRGLKPKERNVDSFYNRDSRKGTPENDKKSSSSSSGSSRSTAGAAKKGGVVGAKERSATKDKDKGKGKDPVTKRIGVRTNENDAFQWEDSSKKSSKEASRSRIGGVKGRDIGTRTDQDPFLPFFKAKKEKKQRNIGPFEEEEGQEDMPVVYIDAVAADEDEVSSPLSNHSSTTNVVFQNDYWTVSSEGPVSPTESSVPTRAPSSGAVSNLPPPPVPLPTWSNPSNPLPTWSSQKPAETLTTTATTSNQPVTAAPIITPPSTRPTLPPSNSGTGVSLSESLVVSKAFGDEEEEEDEADGRTSVGDAEAVPPVIDVASPAQKAKEATNNILSGVNQNLVQGAMEREPVKGAKGVKSAKGPKGVKSAKGGAGGGSILGAQGPEGVTTTATATATTTTTGKAKKTKKVKGLGRSNDKGKDKSNGAVLAAEFWNSGGDEADPVKFSGKSHKGTKQKSGVKATKVKATTNKKSVAATNNGGVVQSAFEAASSDSGSKKGGALSKVKSKVKSKQAIAGTTSGQGTTVMSASEAFPVTGGGKGGKKKKSSSSGIGSVMSAFGPEAAFTGGGKGGKKKSGTGKSSTSATTFANPIVSPGKEAPRPVGPSPPPVSKPPESTVPVVAPPPPSGPSPSGPSPAGGGTSPAGSSPSGSSPSGPSPPTGSSPAGLEYPEASDGVLQENNCAAIEAGKASTESNKKSTFSTKADWTLTQDAIFEDVAKDVQQYLQSEVAPAIAGCPVGPSRRGAGGRQRRRLARARGRRWIRSLQFIDISALITNVVFAEPKRTDEGTCVALQVQRCASVVGGVDMYYSGSDKNLGARLLSYLRDASYEDIPGLVSVGNIQVIDSFGNEVTETSAGSDGGSGQQGGDNQGSTGNASGGSINSNGNTLEVDKIVAEPEKEGLSSWSKTLIGVSSVTAFLATILCYYAYRHCKAAQDIESVSKIDFDTLPQDDLDNDQEVPSNAGSRYNFKGPTSFKGANSTGAVYLDDQSGPSRTWPDNEDDDSSSGGEEEETMLNRIDEEKDSRRVQFISSPYEDHEELPAGATRNYFVKDTVAL